MTRIDQDMIDPPVESESDKIHRMVRTALTSIPVGGGAINELFCAIIEPPMIRRRTQWMVEVTRAINEIYERGLVNEASLQENEVFFSTLVHASNVAIRSHEKEKIQALRNAVVNTAVGSFDLDQKNSIFLSLIDVFSVWHIKILQFYDNPSAYVSKASGHEEGSLGMAYYVKRAFPELESEGDFTSLVWADLYQRRFIHLQSPYGLATDSVKVCACTTKLGKEFLSFISGNDFEKTS